VFSLFGALVLVDEAVILQKCLLEPVRPLALQRQQAKHDENTPSSDHNMPRLLSEVENLFLDLKIFLVKQKQHFLAFTLLVLLQLPLGILYVYTYLSCCNRRVNYFLTEKDFSILDLSVQQVKYIFGEN
jgi:hypothetical protein